ncbi:MAG TPA: thiamine-phosphate kinase [Nitrospira sp.]|nr:thiamine-phosphate kinase [Nitrospira sp.]
MSLRTAPRTIPEFTLIRAIARRFSRRAPQLVRGIGDDAAVVTASPGTWWHLTTDLLAEGVHFDLNTAPLQSVGYRAAVANLSDIAAMGAVPRYLLVSLAIPKRLASSQIHRLYDGLMQACRAHGVYLIGGDTSASTSGLFLSITLIGSTRTGRALFRHGARVGDRLYVTGTLGDSLAGLQLLTQSRRSRSAQEGNRQLRRPERQFLVNRHLHPTARVAEGQWLNHRRLATAAIDISDGLSGDLRHICEESGVGAEIDPDQLPISSALLAYAESRRLDPVQLALTGGEDYELLFTVPPATQPVLERQARARGFRITRIGTIRPGRFGLRMPSIEGAAKAIPITSYEHFR